MYSTQSVCRYWGDCNDANVDIHPNAIELCDGVDNNCDTTLDDPNTVSGVTGGFIPITPRLSGPTFVNPGNANRMKSIYFVMGLTMYRWDASGCDNLIQWRRKLDGASDYPILYSTQDNVVVNVSNLTFQNGYRAIILVGEDTELNVSILNFQNNIALDVQNGTSVSGGAIAIEEGTLNIAGSTFTGNEANFGGAITISGVSIDNTTFDGNIGRSITIAGEETGGQGGAINYQATSNASVFEITDSDFTGNSVIVASAIAMYALDGAQNPYSAVMTLDSVIIEDNVSFAHTGTSNGGTFLIVDSDLINNDSGEGGALMVNFSSEARCIKIQW